MKRQIQIVTATAGFIAASVIAAAAQTPPTTSPQSRPSGSPETITVTGCLQSGSSSSTSTTATTGSTSAMTAAYILTNATKGSSDKTTTTGTTGTTSATTAGSATGTGSTYAIDGSDSDLKRHVGHRIEVTGTMDPASATNPTGTTSTTATTGTTARSDVNAGRIKVSSVKMISADCSASK